MRNDGGGAFAGAWDYIIVDQTGNNPAQKIEARTRGMSLRDYFAAAALQAVIASARSHVDRNDKVIVSPPDYVALAYEYADAMLAEREKP